MRQSCLSSQNLYWAQPQQMHWESATPSQKAELEAEQSSSLSQWVTSASAAVFAWWRWWRLEVIAKRPGITTRHSRNRKTKIVTEWIILVLVEMKCRCTILCFHCSTCFASDCRQQAQHKSESPNHKQMKTKFILNLIKLWRQANTESTDLYLVSTINISVCMFYL